MSKASVVKAEPYLSGKNLGWWGVHYDARGVERERKTFASRELARAWVQAQKRRERGDLSEAAE
jgi:hypothetical protein